jgi:undecaprenyl phosphate-alpha-L-ara4N flippase subunit ArnE
MLLDTSCNILFKKGMNNLGETALKGWRGMWFQVKAVLTSSTIMFGVIAGILQIVVWLAFLSITPLNIAAPIFSANNIFILLASAWILKEKVSPKRWGGVMLIVFGMVLIGSQAA